MKNKKIGIIIVSLLAVVACICGIVFVINAIGVKCVEEKLDIEYQSAYTISDEQILKYDDLLWSSTNESVAVVSGNEIWGIKPGDAQVIATRGDKEVVRYEINVYLVPISQFVLSTNELEMTEGDKYEASYTLVPAGASDYGISWLSVDESVATVTEDGIISAIHPGQTNVIISNHDGTVVGTIVVNTVQKSAYDRLTSMERLLVDTVLKYSGAFKNPNSIRINAVYKYVRFDFPGWYVVELSAENSFGAMTSGTYCLTDDSGFSEYNGNFLSDLISYGFDINLINEALEEKR